MCVGVGLLNFSGVCGGCHSCYADDEANIPNSVVEYGL